MSLFVRKCILSMILFIINTIYLTKSLANCPSSCKCDDETLIVKCGEGHLDVLPIALNPSIQRLVIKNNKIKTIDSSIQFYAELTYLDLSQNHLFNIPQRTFLYQKKLKELHLNHNKIGSINNKTFIGLSSLVILSLRGNFLDDIEEEIFSGLQKLEELNLGQNRISKINPNAFNGLINLKILYLDDNTLTTVPSSIFRSIPALGELYLGVNSFTNLPRRAFENLKALTKLDLKGAGLHNITHESLNGLENLRILDISDNRLRRIPTAELSTLNRLEDLSIGQNNFEVIPEGAFAGLSNLKKLHIIGAYNLRKIENGAFATNTNIETLTIASNKMLSEIQDGAFTGLPFLKHIVLKENALTTLSEGLVSWHDLQTLDLSDNPIHCDCSVLWLRNLLMMKNFSNDRVNVLCASPTRLREEPLKTISPNLLGCSTDSKRKAVIGALLVGSTAALTALILIICRCRKRIRELFKGSWNNSTLEHKEQEYQKTFSDEDYMSKHHHPHPCSLGIHPIFTDYSYNYPPTNIRSLPVTEL